MFNPWFCNVHVRTRHGTLADCGVTRRWTERVLTARHRWCLWSEFRTTSPTSNRRLSFHHLQTISMFFIVFLLNANNMPTDCFNSFVIISAFLFLQWANLTWAKTGSGSASVEFGAAQLAKPKTPKTQFTKSWRVMVNSISRWQNCTEFSIQRSVAVFMCVSWSTTACAMKLWTDIWTDCFNASTVPVAPAISLWGQGNIQVSNAVPWEEEPCGEWNTL